MSARAFPLNSLKTPFVISILEPPQIWSIPFEAPMFIKQEPLAAAVNVNALNVGLD